MTTQYAAASRSQLDSIIARCREKLRREPEEVLEEWAGGPMALSELTVEDASKFIEWLAQGHAKAATPRQAKAAAEESAKAKAEYDDGYQVGYEAVLYRIVMDPDDTLYGRTTMQEFVSLDGEIYGYMPPKPGMPRDPEEEKDFVYKIPKTNYVVGRRAGVAEAHRLLAEGRSAKALFLKVSEEEAAHIPDPKPFYRSREQGGFAQPGETSRGGFGTLGGALRSYFPKGIPAEDAPPKQEHEEVQE